MNAKGGCKAREFDRGTDWAVDNAFYGGATAVYSCHTLPVDAVLAYTAAARVGGKQED